VPEATRLVDISLEAGLNMFDSADVYSDGLAEEILGKAIAGRRDQVIISTKATFRNGSGANDVGSSRHHLIKACEASLRRLGTDYIDLYQMHAFDAQTPIEETLETLDDLVRSGKVRYIGCSNFSGWHLMKSLAISERNRLSRYVAHRTLFADRTRIRMGTHALGHRPESRRGGLESARLGGSPENPPQSAAAGVSRLPVTAKAATGCG
jgi:aryl-alcohol dehydrogenase-like predicted oxidoreductase